MNLNSLEQEILRIALSGEGQVLEQLRRQINFLAPARRDFTGVGFFTKVIPLDKHLLVPVHDFEITDVEGATTSLANGFGCVIFIRGGQIDLIECFTYDEPWPADLECLKLDLSEHPRQVFDELMY